MLLNKQHQMEKRGNSNKNMHHRRVITEVEPIQGGTVPQKESKKTDRVISKPRFIDVYSKYVNKNGVDHKKQVKVI